MWAEIPQVMPEKVLIEVAKFCPCVDLQLVAFSTVSVIVKILELDWKKKSIWLKLAIQLLIIRVSE